MYFTLKRNTHTGGMSLHTEFGYAYCPFCEGDEDPCGTWCALFHLDKKRKCLHQTCSGSGRSIMIELEE